MIYDIMIYDNDMVIIMWYVKCGIDGIDGTTYRLQSLNKKPKMNIVISICTGQVRSSTQYCHKTKPEKPG